MGERLHDGEVLADEALVRGLLADQHPRLVDRTVRRIPSTGTDHAVFRLGDDLAVRMPRIGWAEQQVDRESVWLGRLGSQLPVAVPLPVAVGEPGRGYPFRWLVSTWVGGRDLLASTVDGAPIDGPALAVDLAGFVRALHRVDASDGPVSGKRGRLLVEQDPAVRAAIPAMAGEADPAALLAVWEAGLAAEPWADPVWVHGDLLPGNVVLDGRGRLAGVIDWGPTGVGDPACDLMIAWSLPAADRAAFREAVGLDGATWVRARAWVVEQTVPFIPYYERTLPDAVAVTRARLAALLDEAAADGA